MKNLFKSLVFMLALIVFASCSSISSIGPTKTVEKVDSNSAEIVADSNLTAIVEDENSLDENVSLSGLDALLVDDELASIAESNVATTGNVKVSEGNVSAGKTTEKKVIKTTPKKEVLKFTPKKVAFKKASKKKVFKPIPKNEIVTKKKVAIPDLGDTEFNIDKATINVKNLKIVTPDNMGYQKIDFKTPDEERNLIKAFSVNIPGEEDKNVSITYNHSYDINDSGVYGCTVIIFGKDLAKENIEVSGVVKSAKVKVLAKVGKICINDDNAKAESEYDFDIMIEALKDPKISVLMKFKMIYTVPKDGARYLLIKKNSFIKEAPFIEEETPLGTKNLEANPVLKIDPPLK